MKEQKDFNFIRESSRELEIKDIIVIALEDTLFEEEEN